MNDIPNSQEAETSDHIKESRSLNFEKIKELSLKHAENLSLVSRELEYRMNLEGVSSELEEFHHACLNTITYGIELRKLINENWNSEYQKLYELFENSDLCTSKVDEINDNIIQYLTEINESDSIRKFNAAKATTDKYKYITSIAIEVTKEYATQHPKKLNEKICIRGVKTDIEKEIYDRLSAISEYKKASLSKPPSEKTITKHRKLAFTQLGYN